MNKRLASILLTGISALLVAVLHGGTAHALAFDPTRIIDDAVFYNYNSMSAQDIQNFLNSKVPTCDTQGTQPSEFGGGTRAQYGTAHGYPPPYICLKDYYENPSTLQNNLNGTIPAGAISAAQIIYNAAQSYHINPQVIITTLQKESSLVTDTWPFPTQYKTAMGYGCPDTAPCNSQYYGFYNQVTDASWQFRQYATNPNNYNYVPGPGNFVQYNPNAGCGGTTLNIQNQATASLYDYTPYQPNAAALAAGYGTGDSCSAYGNRNFWLYFNNWFNVSDTIRSGVVVNINTQPDTTPARGEAITYVFTFTNTMNYSVNLSGIGAVGRLGSLYGTNRDLGWVGSTTLAANSSQQFTFSTTLSDTGSLYVWPALNYFGTYIQYNNWGSSLTIHEPNISVVSALTPSTSNPVAGQTVTFTATVKNNESHPIHMDAIGIPIRYYNRYSYDTGWITPTGSAIAAGATQDINGSIVFDKPGPFTAWLAWAQGSQYTALTQTLNLPTVNPSPNFILTFVQTPHQTPALGEDVSIGFKLKNTMPVSMTLNAVGIVGRDGSPGATTNDDLGWNGPITFAANEEKTFTFTRTISQTQNLYTWVAVNYQGAYIQYTPWSFTLTPHLPNVSISSPLTVNSGTKPTVGQTVPVTVGITNNESVPIHYQALGIPIRLNGTYNYDTAWQGPATLSASGQSGDSLTLSGNVTFDKSGSYTLWTSLFAVNGKYYNIGSQTNLDL